MPHRSKDIAVIILAAGKGTRMKSDLPKVLHKIAGKPMVSYVINAAASLKPEKKIIVISPDGKDVVKAAKGAESAIQTQQLGTADAVKSALPALKNFSGNVLILYADCPLITPATLLALVSAHKPKQISMLGFNAANPSRYGRLVTKGKEVNEIVEFYDASDKQKQISLCNSGIYFLDAKLLAELLSQVTNKNARKEFYLTDIIKLARKKGVKTYFQLVDEHEVSGVNDKSELAIAENITQQKLRHDAMVNGVTMLAPETVFLSADTKFGKNVLLRPNVVIGENVTIGDNTTIGPFSHLRDGTVLKNGAEIGNYVEVKKSTIGENSKVKHLSYIGDATLGAEVNIGAGTITCNYDGVNKFQTTIENGVFVGSNTALLAPVTLGEGSIIAAGSTIGKDVPAGALGIARSLQKNLANWAAQFKSGKNKKG